MRYAASLVCHLNPAGHGLDYRESGFESHLATPVAFDRKADRHVSAGMRLCRHGTTRLWDDWTMAIRQSHVKLKRYCTHQAQRAGRKLDEGFLEHRGGARGRRGWKGRSRRGYIELLGPASHRTEGSRGATGLRDISSVCTARSAALHLTCPRGFPPFRCGRTDD